MTGALYAPSNSLIWSAGAINEEDAKGLFGRNPAWQEHKPEHRQARHLGIP